MGLLERKLLKLSADTLTPDQEKQRQHLHSTAAPARLILMKEEADMKRLRLASRALDAAQAVNAGEHLSQLSTAGQELDAIPSRSFLVAEADRLRLRLIGLERKPSTAPCPNTESLEREVPISSAPAAQREPRSPSSAQPPPQS